MKEEIVKFIRDSKRQAYASSTSKPKKTKDGGKTYVVKNNHYVYTDTYFGNLIDCGQERVFVNGKVFWVMSYRGGIEQKFEKLHNEAFNFLKKCIIKMPKNFPARGPKELKFGKWKYKNKWKGNIDGFVGKESIYYNNEKVCFRNYLGGLIKNKK